MTTSAQISPPPASPPPPAAWPPAAVHYPDSDGRPMGETEVHVQCLIDTHEALWEHFRAEALVYVGSNLLLYYEAGNIRRFVVPDVFVARGIAKRVRRTYLAWEEGKAPDWVLEITSASTRREDERTKRALCRRLGVTEYFLYDPLGEYLRPPLQGFRLVDGQYQPLEPLAGGGLRSAVLGLELWRREGALRLYDPLAGRWLLTPREEAAARQAAEAEVARLRAELARRRGPESRPAE